MSRPARRHRKSVAVFGSLYAISGAPTRVRPLTRGPASLVGRRCARSSPGQPLTRSASVRAVAESGPGWATNTAAR